MTDGGPGPRGRRGRDQRAAGESRTHRARRRAGRSRRRNSSGRGL